VSEQPAETAPSGGGKQILGMRPRTFYIMMGAAVVAGLGYYWYKNYKAGQAAAAAPATTTASGTGNTDYSGELSAIQTELEALMQQQNTGTTTPTPTPTPATTPSGPVSVAVPNGSGGWMNYTFPTQAALDTFYKNIGVTNGAYPNGIGTQQFLSALQAVGATPLAGSPPRQGSR
jgi:hypothetical protein